MFVLCILGLDRNSFSFFGLFGIDGFRFMVIFEFLDYIVNEVCVGVDWF